MGVYTMQATQSIADDWYVKQYFRFPGRVDRRSGFARGPELVVFASPAGGCGVLLTGPVGTKPIYDTYAHITLSGLKATSRLL